MWELTDAWTLKQNCIHENTVISHDCTQQKSIFYLYLLKYSNTI